MLKVNSCGPRNPIWRTKRYVGVLSCHRSKICQKDSPHQNVFKLTLSRKSFYVFALTPKIQDYTEMSTDEGCVLCLSLIIIMSSHLITNRMRFYFFQSKCVVNVSSACHFPTRGGMQCKIVRRSLSFPRSKFENFMGYSCFMGYP